MTGKKHKPSDHKAGKGDAPLKLPSLIDISRADSLRGNLLLLEKALAQRGMACGWSHVYVALEEEVSLDDMAAHMMRCCS